MHILFDHTPIRINDDFPWIIERRKMQKESEIQFKLSINNLEIHFEYYHQNPVQAVLIYH